MTHSKKPSETNPKESGTNKHNIFSSNEREGDYDGYQSDCSSSSCYSLVFTSEDNDHMERQLVQTIQSCIDEETRIDPQQAASLNLTETSPIFQQLQNLFCGLRVWASIDMINHLHDLSRNTHAPITASIIRHYLSQDIESKCDTADISTSHTSNKRRHEPKTNTLFTSPHTPNLIESQISDAYITPPRKRLHASNLLTPQQEQTKESCTDTFELSRCEFPRLEF